MDFARKQLEKYGWKEGEGLGKNKTGISKPLRPKLKFDTGGLGHDVFEDINNTWWQRVYDEAAKNIVTKKNKKDAVVFETVDTSVEITTKRKKNKKHKKSKEEQSVYKDFIKTSELNQNGEIKLRVEDEEEEEEPKAKVKKVTSGICDLTDEELFKICGGRTAHKGARHGLKMNAKLARIEKQESEIGFADVRGKTSNENEDKVKKHKKSKKKKREESESDFVDSTKEAEDDSFDEVKKNKKNKKKKRKESDLDLVNSSEVVDNFSDVKKHKKEKKKSL